MGFTGPLLRRARGSGPCAVLEQRCQGVLKALAEVPQAFEVCLEQLHRRLEDKAAAEWRGCDERKQPSSQTPCIIPAVAAATGNAAEEKQNLSQVCPVVVAEAEQQAKF